MLQSNWKGGIMSTIIKEAKENFHHNNSLMYKNNVIPTSQKIFIKHLVLPYEELKSKRY